MALFARLPQWGQLLAVCSLSVGLCQSVPKDYSYSRRVLSSLRRSVRSSHTPSRANRNRQRQKQEGKQGHTGLKVLFRSQYLVLIFLLILTTQVVSTVLDLRFNGLVADSIAHPDIRTAYYGAFYKWLGISAALLQFIAVPLFLRWAPFQLIHLYIPLIHFVTAGLLSFSPSLPNGAAAYLIFKALDYSFFRSGKELFYIPLSYDERYRAKQIIDSFGYRSAKSGSGFLIGLLSIPGTMFAPIAMAMAVIWTGIVAKLTVQYQKLEERITS